MFIKVAWCINFSIYYTRFIIFVIVDTSELREAEKVRASQEKALQALQDYTLAHYPEIPAKFGELLLRIPELQRACNVSENFRQEKTLKYFYNQ